MSSPDNGESEDRSQIGDDVAQALDVICGGNVHAPDKKIESNRECLCGESVSALWTPRPQGGPETNRRMESRSTVEDLIRLRSGCTDLSNILLLVTPGEQKNCHAVHCYRLDTRRHRGVTTVTQKEIRLIECYHEPDNYSIVYCTGYIDPADAARNTPIKGEVFEMVQEASKAVRRTWYKGKAVRLAYRCSRSKFVGVSPPKRNIFGIRSLEQPKIKVRMPSHLAFVASAESIRKERKLRLRRNLQTEFHYTSQENLDKTNLKPNVRGTRSTDPLRRRHAGSDLCEHLGFNFQKVRAKRPKLVSTRKINKSSVKPSPQMVAPTVEPDEIQVLMQSRGLRNSSYHTAMLPSDPPDFDSVIHLSSTSFTCTMDPLELPSRFSEAALWHLERKLSSPSARDAFAKLGTLVGQINEQPCPNNEHLQRFFRLAVFLDFKMYVREESNFPGWPPIEGPRIRVECYVFDDRREYMASICLLRSQLRAMTRLFPKARGNFRFIDNAFDLTPMPTRLTKWLKANLDAIRARPVFDLLGELTLDIARPPAAVFEVDRNLAAVGK